MVVIALLVCGSVAGGQGNTGQQPSQRLDPAIQEMVSKISQDRIVEILKKLESFGTRNTLSSPDQPNRGVGSARQWIFDQFKSYSPRLEVSYDTYSIPRGGRVWRDLEARNVMAILPGKTDPDRWIIIGGHYDSLNLQIPAEIRGDQAKAAEVDAPGVTDNASGTACAMECARVLSQYEFRATLVFVAFIGEEQGLLGATGLAKRLREKNQQVQAVLNNDIIGSDLSGNGSSSNERILVFSEDPNDSLSRQLARYIKLMGQRYYPEFTADMIFRADRFGRGGDHTPFNQQGFAAVRFTTPYEHFGNQHSPSDTFANTSPLLTARVTRLNAAALAAMALAPRSPVTIQPSVPRGSAPGATAPASGSAAQQAQTGAAQAGRGGAPPAQSAAGRGGRGQGVRPGLTRGEGYDAVLRWDYPNPDPDLAGFMVVVRSTTAPDWEREIWTGNVREFTLKNTPIDQLVFGVKSVDSEGHESPVSAYGLPSRASGSNQ